MFLEVVPFPCTGSDSAGHAPEAGGDGAGHGSSDVDNTCNGQVFELAGGQYCITDSRLADFLIGIGILPTGELDCFSPEIVVNNNSFYLNYFYKAAMTQMTLWEQELFNSTPVIILPCLCVVATFSFILHTK